MGEDDSPRLARHQTLAGSRAFREASLRSEVRRVYAVFGITVLLMVIKRVA